MLLTGNFEKTLDEKRRVALPKRLRDGFGGADVKILFLAPGFDKSLKLYNEEGYKKVSDRLSAHTENNPDARHFFRSFYSQTEQVELDRQGRFIIPEKIAGFAGLTSDIIFLGILDHVEIWDLERWNDYYDTQADGFDEIATDVMSTR